MKLTGQSISVSRSLITVVVVFLALLVGGGILIAGCTVIPPGYVGIKVNQSGGNRGVEQYPILTGRQFYNPINERIYEYPIFLQTVVWTKDLREGAAIDQSITFNSVEGAVVNVDVSLSYAFITERVPAIFVEFRRSPQEITDSYMRTKVRDAFSRVSSTMPVVDIYGAKKQELLANVKEDLIHELEPKGFRIDTISMVGNPRLDPNVITSINQAIQAQQDAQRAQNKVAQVEAEARQKVAEAEGEAKRITTIADAQAAANERLTKLLTAQLVQYEALQKWDGKMPQVTGSGGMPFIQLQGPGGGK
ncbi:MAG: SPFH domain-containing protein [Acidobacteriota bacterium]|nr:SPFH domain-containing protein [Acidobacteriota bacterium]